MNSSNFLDTAIKKVEAGEIKQAWNFFKKALDCSGEDKGQVLFEIGRFCFFCGEYEEAMDYFVKAYIEKYNCQQIKEIILEAFYYPNETEIQTRYETNISALKNYQYKMSDNFREFNKLDYLYIPVTENKMIIFDKNLEEFVEYYYKNEAKDNLDEFGVGDVVLVLNENTTSKILEIKNATYNPSRYLTMRNALYLYYETKAEFENNLQVLDLAEILKDDRIVFLFGENELNSWFDNSMYNLPQIVVGNPTHVNRMIEVINQINLRRAEIFNENKKILDKYYKDVKKDGIVERIQDGKPRIYILTSRFTTALQYHARDCEMVLKELGCEVLLRKEENDLMTYNGLQRVTDIKSFRPDIIFCIDHFRQDIDPPEIVYVNWIQDPLPSIMNEEAPKKLIEMDIILNAYFTSKELLNYGYPQNKMIDGPIGANDRVYHKREVAASFYEKHKADIIAFSNAGDPDKGFEEFCKQIEPLINQNSQIKEVFYQLYRRVYKDAYNGVNLYSKEQYRELIQKELIKNAWEIKNSGLDQVVKAFRHSVGYRILRSVPLEWLAEKGYDLKIYGDEWVTHKKLKKYAMGRAENGEILSKIITCSKIVVGTNQSISTHPRVGETFLSGALYIGAEIPKEFDDADIEVYLEKNKEILLFKNKSELFYQVDYFLNHEKERLEIIENAHQAVTVKLTHKALMKQMLKKIPEIIKEEMGGE